MKFSADQLSRALAICQKVAPKNGVLAITELVHLKKTGTELVLEATDLEVSVFVKYKPGGKKNFEALIDPVVLKALKGKTDVNIELTKDEEIEYTFNDESKLKQQHYSVGDYPDLNVEEIDYAFSHNENIFDIIKRVSAFTTTDELRPAMTGVNIIGKMEEQTVTFVASDGHKLIRYTLPTAGVHKDFSVVITKSFANKLAAFKNINAVTFSTSGLYVEIEFFVDELEVCFRNRIINQTYPDFNAVIPVDQPRAFAVNKKEFINKLMEVDVWTNKTTHQIVVDLKEKTISTKDLDFRTDYSVKFNPQTEWEDRMVFNCRFLLELLKVTDQDELIFQYNVSDKPHVLGKVTKPVTINNENELLLIMPIIEY